VLVLLSFALVLAATVLLVLGLLNAGLTLIYLSIVCSVAAAAVLIVALRSNKSRAELNAPLEPLPIGREPVASPAPAPTLAPVAASVAAVDATSTGSEWLASDFEAVDGGVEEDVEEEVEFPIADYDDLTAGQILPLLPQLYADEIGVVEARELATKGRPEILERLAQLRGDVPVPVAPTAAPTAWADEDEWFPIDDYESLSAAQIRPLLGELDPEELALVRDRELSLGRRRSLLDDIERRLEGPEPPAPAPVTPPPVAPIAAATTPAPNVTAENAPATKAPAAKKAPAKKAPAAKKTPAKKAAAKKTPAKKAAAPAKQTPAKKAAASAKKAAPAKKATKKTS
jgi:hypothetical protein